MRGASRVFWQQYNPSAMDERPTPQELKDRIVVGAHKLGFELVGVTTPDPPPHLDVYENWLQHARHGEMGYLATQRGRRARSDPREIMPDCKSILVVGMNYLPHEAGSAHGETEARVATYALGDDYHDVIPRRLEQLVRRLEGWVGEPVPNRIYTDTGPILERELAQRAGLGWIGRNTCLIHPQLGSYYFLAEVFLGIALPPDDPVRTDHCGSCTRCLEACPTGCILPDRTLDATRCISYLTIELRGEIPPDQRQDLADWVFGCDICQQVCPWNERFAEPTDEQAFQARPLLAEAKPETFLRLSNEEYQQAFRSSAIKRSKRTGLARNAAVVAANRGDQSAVPVLEEALLADPDPSVRQHAAWALGDLGGAEAVQALRAAAIREKDETVLGELRAALGA